MLLSRLPVSGLPALALGAGMTGLAGLLVLVGWPPLRNDLRWALARLGRRAESRSDSDSEHGGLTDGLRRPRHGRLGQSPVDEQAAAEFTLGGRRAQGAVRGVTGPSAARSLGTGPGPHVAQAQTGQPSSCGRSRRVGILAPGDTAARFGVRPEGEPPDSWPTVCAERCAGLE